MKQIVTHAIVLSRFNYGEADRIITVITPEQGKLKLLARGVRKIKSKLSGSVELFSVSTLTYIKGKSEINTLISGKLQSYFSDILEDFERTTLGYEVLKVINKATQDNPESEYYHLLLQTLIYLNDIHLNLNLVKCWFFANLLKIQGHELNTRTDIDGKKLSQEFRYNYNLNEQVFYVYENGDFQANHIKLLRLLTKNDPTKLQLIMGKTKYLKDISTLLSNVIKIYLSYS